MAWIRDCNSCRAVIVGGEGYIGLEMAEQLRHRGLRVTVVEALPQVGMAPLDPKMAAWLHAELKSEGVWGIALGDSVATFEAPRTGETSRATVVVLKSGKRVEADIVVLGLGVRPEVSLAKNAGLELGALGGVRVDEHLPGPVIRNIYAVGDAIEVHDAVTGAWSIIPMAGPANRQGRIAADNICSAVPLRRNLGHGDPAIVQLTAGCTGANEKSCARPASAFKRCICIPVWRPGYYPGAEPIAMKILFAPETGKLLGAQAIGHDGVNKRIDVLGNRAEGADR